MQAAAQDPSPNDVTSNTQWSLVYDDTDLTAQIVIRRKWDDVIHYDLNTNEIDGSCYADQAGKRLLHSI